MNAKQLKEKISKAQWELNFENFCKLVDCRPDSYGVELWEAFHKLYQAINRFDTGNLQKILDYSGH